MGGGERYSAVEPEGTGLTGVVQQATGSNRLGETLNFCFGACSDMKRPINNAPPTKQFRLIPHIAFSKGRAMPKQGDALC